MDLSGAQGTSRGMPPEYTWVETPAAFRSMRQSLEPVSRVAVDIEADSLYHYFEKVCLVQISTDAETFVVDPLALRDLGALGPIMASPAVEKVFHAAGYDVFCLRRDYRFSFANVFDTHVAAQLLGYEQLGLSALLEKLLGVVHSKRRQRDDWSRRPLDREQLEYAAMDTHHLLQLRDLLERQLREKGREEWAREEFEAAATSELPEREFDPEGFRRIKGNRNLSLQQRAILRALFLVRDQFAREMDLPPFKVLNNPVLLDLARKPPGSPQALFQRRGVSYRVARRFGREIYRTIEQARSQDTSILVSTPQSSWKPPSREAKLRLEKLRAWRKAKARELELHVGVVFPGNLLELLAMRPPEDQTALAKLPGVRRWRVREFGKEVLQALHAEN